MSMTAYAPYTGERGTLAGVIQASTTSEKQVGTARATIDFLYAEGGGSQTNPRVEFQFFHKMSQLVLAFKAGGGLELDDISYTLKISYWTVLLIHLPEVSLQVRLQGISICRWLKVKR